MTRPGPVQVVSKNETIPPVTVRPPRPFRPCEVLPRSLPQHDVLLSGHWRHQTAANKAYIRMDPKPMRSLDSKECDVQKHIKEPLRELLKQDLGVNIPLPTFWIGADKVADIKHWAHQAHHVKPGTKCTFAVGANPYQKLYTVYEVSDDGIRFENKEAHRRPRPRKKKDKTKEAEIPQFIGGDPTKPDSATGSVEIIVAGPSTASTVPEMQTQGSVFSDPMDIDSDLKLPAICAGRPQAALSQDDRSLSSSVLAAVHTKGIGKETNSVSQSSLVPSQSRTVASDSLDTVTMTDMMAAMSISLPSSAKTSLGSFSHSSISSEALKTMFTRNDAHTSWLYDVVIAAKATGTLNIADKMLDANDVALLMYLFTEVGAEVTQLDLSLNSIEDTGLAAVAEWLEKNTTSPLVKLHLLGNDIDDDGAVAFGKALQVNTALQDLSLGVNEIGNAGAMAFGSALALNTASALVKLDLWNNAIADVGAAALGRALAVNTTLQELNLVLNKLSNVGAVAIAEGIETNTASALVKLNLGHNCVGNNGAVAFGKVLSVNTALQELDLASNKISNVGAVALAEGLGMITGSALLKLDLSDNEIDEDGAVAFGKALVVNTILQELDLGANRIRYVGAVAIAEGLEKNTASALLKLDLSGNDIGDDCAVAFRKPLEENTALFVRCIQHIEAGINVI